MMLFQPCQSSLPVWAWLFLSALFWLPEIQGNCTSPVPPPHSTLKEDPPKKNYPVGTNLTYHCNTGYEYIPGINPSVTCLNTSKWSEISELCREVKCDRPEVENGKITDLPKPSYSYNESVSFECNSGYSAVGSLHIKCGDNSLWVPAIPKCVKDNCTSPILPPHSTLKEEIPKEGFPVGTNLTYYCITGYEYIPGINPLVTCLNTSKWSEISELCQGKKCPAPIIENGKVDAEDDIRLGGSVTFSCIPGFRLIGEATRKCILKDGKVDWNSTLPYCEHIPCKRPDPILNGQYDPDPKDEYYVGSVVIYRCNRDFSLIGNSTIRCITTEDGLNGKWNSPAPECKQVKCDRPKVENGKITTLPKPSYTYNEAVSFKCNSGYSAEGSLYIKCGANSSWVPAIPRCVKDNCTSPVLPPHSTLKEEIPKEGFPVGTNLTYHCITGYEYIPGINPSVTCLNTSKWSEISELCQGKKCPAPIIENGKVDAEDDVRLGGSVTFSCVPGFRLIGEATRKCILKDGKVDWNSTLPYCEHIPCKRPDIILNGQYDPDPKDEYYVGSVVIYRCNRDFSLIGNSTIRCITTEDGLNGKWNSPAPECKQVKCDRPEVENGKITDLSKPSYTYNEAISIECNPGYSAEGSLHIKCGANSSWVPPTPKCVKVILSPTQSSTVNEKPNTTSKDYAECNKTTALGKLIILLAVLYNCW